MPDTDEISRRRFLRLAGVAGIAAGTSLSATGLTSCSSGASDSVKLGVIAPFSGPGAPMGAVVNNSLEASLKHLNSTGGIEGRKVELLLRDAGAEPDTGPRLYGELAGQADMIGVLWCGALGLDQVLPRMRDDGMPVVTVFNDLQSRGLLHPRSTASGTSVFQMQLPSTDVYDTLAAYAADDRQYASAALLYDATLDPDGMAAQQFEDAFGRAGIDVKGVEPFATDDTDYGEALQRLADAAPQVLFIDGGPESTAAIVTALADRGAAYTDTPSAKATPWRPHVFGSPSATGTAGWADLAGEAASTGTISAGTVGGLRYLKTYAVGDWMRTFLGKQPTGGEQLPADALATLLEGMRKAGTTDHRRLVKGIETMGPKRFASVDFSYAADRHVAHTPDDVVILALERLRGPAPTEPPYQLGSEWSLGGAFANTAATPTQLLRPTLEANRRAHPEVMDEVLRASLGTQCTKLPGGTLAKECKVH